MEFEAERGGALREIEQRPRLGPAGHRLLAGGQQVAEARCHDISRYNAGEEALGMEQSGCGIFQRSSAKPPPEHLIPTGAYTLIPTRRL